MPFSQIPPHRKLNIKSVDDTTYLVPTKYPLRTAFGGFDLIPEGEARKRDTYQFVGDRLARPLGELSALLTERVCPLVRAKSP